MLAAFHHQCQRPRPELFGQFFSVLRKLPQPKGRFCIGQVGDQRVELGPPLGCEYPRHGFVGRCISTQAVNGLGREGHETSVFQELCCGQDIAGIDHRLRPIAVAAAP